MPEPLRLEATYKGVPVTIELEARAVLGPKRFSLDLVLTLPVKADVHPARASVTIEAFLKGLDTVIEAAQVQGVDLAERRGDGRLGSTWRCHACGDERPDAVIAVFTRRVFTGTLAGQEHVRYCRDRQECVEGARRVSWLRPRWQCEDCDEPTFALDDRSAAIHSDTFKHSLALSYWSIDHPTGGAKC